MMLYVAWIRMSRIQRVFLIGLVLMYVLVGWQHSLPFLLRMLVETSCYALLALALSVQWGYAGLFNAGVVGFVAIGGYSMLLTVPRKPEFWSSLFPAEGLALFLVLMVFITISMVCKKMSVLSESGRRLASRLTILLGILVVLPWFLNLTARIENDVGFIGGLGLHPFVAWIFGGLLAAFIAWGVGRICLELRSDYLAIATLGIAEIIRSVLKNADWLTNGVRPIGPLAWPVPNSGEVGFVVARAGFLAIVLTLIVCVFWLLHRGYNSPWGRTMRAIRDNETSASAMGKYASRKRLECFILGAALMGFTGSVLTNFNGIFDATGYLPITHTFLIWVMVIVGGAGNNFGTIVGAALVFLFWNQSESISLAVFHFYYDTVNQLFDWPIPNDLDSRALQVRVFIVGFIIVLVMRYAPDGIFPERPPKHD